LCLAALGNRWDEASTLLWTRNHGVSGNARLTVEDGNLVVENLADRSSLLYIDLNGANAFNTYFEPVEIPVGRTFTAELYGDDGLSLARLDLVQTDHRETTLILSLEDVLPYIKDGTVRVSTHLDGQTTYSRTMAAAELMELGVVHSTSAGWAKTYHLVCTEGSCTLAVDPDETLMAFADAPNVVAPFRYLAVQFDLNEGISTQPTRVTLGGAGLPNLVITGEDTVPLTL
jgi:hypothetical protein